MKTFLVLIAVSLLSPVMIKLGGGEWLLPLSARIGMSAMLDLTAVGHFVFAEGKVMIVPDFIPLKKKPSILRAS